jgi:pimeloyl-ACP methyl ester carboxylesterase
MALDLLELLEHLKKQYGLTAYHLCGHSLGGAIGYEALRHNNDEYRNNLPVCLSFILSNASTNFNLSELKESKDSMNEFIAAHVCRTEKFPKVLRSAMSRRGKEWSANDYVAVPLERQLAHFPLVLIIRGEYDFVTEVCTNGWKCLIGKPIQDARIILILRNQRTSAKHCSIFVLQVNLCRYAKQFMQESSAY